jgi:uncharacterized repeat protein (TIGR03833 family)
MLPAFPHTVYASLGVHDRCVFCMVNAALGETFQPQRGIIHRIAATPAGEKSEHHMNGKHRTDIQPGLQVRITQKQDQRSGKLTGGIVQDILTKSAYHPHGIKVRLQTGEVGRVQEIVAPSHEVAERGRTDMRP